MTTCEQDRVQDVIDRLRGYEHAVRIVDDMEACFEECNGQPRPLTEAEYAENAYMDGDRRIPYAEYLEYYGNPARHVYLGIIVEERPIGCGCDDDDICGHWDTLDSLWGIDLMYDDPCAQQATGERLSIAEARALKGYLGDVVRDLIGGAL